jgi:oxygen-independent coproporphyrinogen-3 oxidase
MVASDTYQDKYIDYLIKDLENNLKSNDLIETIYIGGGTPSSLSNKNLDRLLYAINKKINSIKEFTIELNPEDINYDLIRILRKYPINRISIGIQTFNKKFQELLNRYSDFEDILEKMNLLKLAGFTNINVDLMYGFANQTLKDLHEDIDKMCQLNPTHISTYSLILEEKTIFYQITMRGKSVTKNN